MNRTDMNRQLNKDEYTMYPGQDLVLCGYPAIAGTIMAVQKKRDRLSETLPADLLDTALGFLHYLREVPEAAVAIQHGATAMHSVKTGGIFAALWEMAEMFEVGLTVWLKKIPVRQETIEICEIIDMNPYQMLSDGCVLMAADNGYDLVIECEQRNIPSAVIGKVTDSNDRIILNGENRRFINKPQKDEIYKLEE